MGKNLSHEWAQRVKKLVEREKGAWSASCFLFFFSLSWLWVMKLRSSIQQLAAVCLVMTAVSSSYPCSPSHLVPKEFALGWIPWHPLCFDPCGLFIFPLSGVIKLKMPTVVCVCVCVCPGVLRSDVHWLASEAIGHFLSLLAGTGITSVCLLAFNVGAGTWT